MTTKRPKKRKVLILVPGKNARGGITNYYTSIRKHFSDNILYMARGSRHWPKQSSRFTEILRIIRDYINFIRILTNKDVALVQVSMPFSSKAIIRDGLFVILAKLMSKKVVIFFRGWQNNFVPGLKGLKLDLIKRVIFRADAIIELSESNIEYFRKLGYKRKIYLETTLVDQSLVEDIAIHSIVTDRLTNKVKNILFLSRIEKAKGIYELKDVYKKIKINHPEFTLTIAGDGSELGALTKTIDVEKLADVQIPGFVEGNLKKELLLNAWAFVFLSESEGMPNAVLEAMSFGLPVIVTNVGGIRGVVKSGENGLIVNEIDLDYISRFLIQLAKDKNTYQKYAITNYEQAKRSYWSARVATRLLRIFEEVDEVDGN